MVSNCNSTEDSLASDRATKWKPKGTEQIPLLSTLLRSCLEFYVEDHLQVMFVECIPVRLGSKKLYKKLNENSLGQSVTMRAEKPSGRPHPLLRGCWNADFYNSISFKPPVIELIRGQFRYDSTVSFGPRFHYHSVLVWVKNTVQYEYDFCVTMLYSLFWILNDKLYFLLKSNLECMTPLTEYFYLHSNGNNSPWK